jgi:hypothetical protein
LLRFRVLEVAHDTSVGAAQVTRAAARNSRRERRAGGA